MACGLQNLTWGVKNGVGRVRAHSVCRPLQMVKGFWGMYRVGRLKTLGLTVFRRGSGLSDGKVSGGLKGFRLQASGLLKGVIKG